MGYSDKLQFSIEWNHYLIGELDVDDFSFFFDKYVKKYLNI